MALYIDIIKLIEDFSYLGVSIGQSKSIVKEILGSPIEEYEGFQGLQESFYKDNLKITYYEETVCFVTIESKGVKLFAFTDYKKRGLKFKYFGKKNSLHKLFAFLFTTSYNWEIIHLISNEDYLIIHINEKIEIVNDLNDGSLYKLTIGDLSRDKSS